MRKAFSTLLCGTLFLCGCPPTSQTVGHRPPSPVDIADRMDLLTSPAAINWDDTPGPDGVQLQVYFFMDNDRDKFPLAVRGSMEMILYEGRVKFSETSATQPFRRWRFTPQQMEGFLVRGWAGWCYAITLPWDRDVPRTQIVTLRAKYTSPQGQLLYAAPVSISMGMK